MTRAIELLGAALLALVLSGGITGVAVVDRLYGIGQRTEADALAELSMRAELARMAKCNTEQGQALAVWVSDTQVKCMPRSGRTSKTYRWTSLEIN